MLIVRECTEHVVGLPTETGCAGEPTGATALGVYSAIAPMLEEAFGNDVIEDRSFVISGLGQVGSRLARKLVGHGARLIVTDIDDRKRRLAEELGAEWIAPEAALTTPADVLVPAGLGGILTGEAIDALGRRGSEGEPGRGRVPGAPAGHLTGSPTPAHPPRHRRTRPQLADPLVDESPMHA